MKNTGSAAGKTLKVLTCNIRYAEAPDGKDAWTFRKPVCIEAILAQDADIICCQEVAPVQFDDLRAALGAYDVYALHEAAGSPRPQNAIFYRRSRFTLTVASGYWLSETPHVPGSRSWNSACIRFANWVRLDDSRADNRSIRIVNTHLDHVSHEARVNQARLLCEDADAYPDTFPQVLTGDFNCDGPSAPLATLRAGGWIDSYGAVHGTETPGPTFHAFQGSAHAGTVDKMDWVMMRGALTAQAAQIIREPRDGRYPSDHYFVSGTFALA